MTHQQRPAHVVLASSQPTFPSWLSKCALRMTYLSLMRMAFMPTVDTYQLAFCMKRLKAHSYLQMLAMRMCRPV